MKRHSVPVRVAFVLWMVWRGLRWFVNGESPFAITADVLIVGLIAYEIWAQGWLQQRARRKRLQRTYRLNIDGESEAHVGDFSVPITVQIGHPVQLGRFNVRFIEDRSGMSGGRVNAPIESIHIRGLEDTSSQTPDGIRSWADQKGGFYGMWESKPTFDNGEALRLLIHVRALRPWSGKLSFRSHDVENQRRTVAVPFRVI